MPDDNVKMTVYLHFLLASPSTSVQNFFSNYNPLPCFMHLLILWIQNFSVLNKEKIVINIVTHMEDGCCTDNSSKHSPSFKMEEVSQTVIKHFKIILCKPHLKMK